jgi:hypothetical protein
MTVLALTRWRDLEAAHEARVDAATEAHRRRRALGEKHPTEDFLFTYYPTTPTRLRRWHPRASWRFYGADDQIVSVDASALATTRAEGIRFVRDLLSAVDGREPQLGCFALHEWAMVYRLPAEQVRHTQLPLRLGPAGTDAVVESHSLRCTHIDAFRFFAPEAVPRNALQPRRDTQVALDQPGCLHAGMDLYKWATKLTPAVPSELVMDCFDLARDLRRLDMQASPYDVTVLGDEPILIETPVGKADYLAALQPLMTRAAALRRRLLTVCDALLQVASGVPIVRG